MNVRTMFDLDGKVALITGGSRGLGLQMAEALTDMGCAVAITARHASDLEEASAALSARGARVAAIVNDLQEPGQIPSLVDRVLSDFGAVDILVNNAGANWAAPAEEYPDHAWHKLMNLNVSAQFFLAREVASRHMIPAKAGKIINVASIAGLRGTAPGVHTVGYNTSKAAAINLARTLASEWGRYNINVNAICPGFFPTKMTHGLLEKIEEGLKARTPLRRLGGPDDLKGAIVFLASEASRHITGQVLAVDGGSSII